MDEMLQFEKKTEEKKRVYTYEKALERYYTFLFMGFLKGLLTIYSSSNFVCTSVV